MRQLGGCLFIYFFLPIVALGIESKGAESQYRLVNINGGSATGGRDFASELIDDKCMMNSGWKVSTLQSENFVQDISKTSNIDPKQAKALEEMFNSVNFDRVLESSGENVRRFLPKVKTEKDALNQIRELILDSASSLNNKDHLLIRVTAHGTSNCDAQINPDILSGIRTDQGAGLDQCNLQFSVTAPCLECEPNHQRDIGIGASDFAKLIGDLHLEKRGIKVGVEVISCFGGAGLKDFAAHGICAYAYSSPDTPSESCLDDPSDDNDQQSSQALSDEDRKLKTI